MSGRRTVDVLVIGGGVIGSSTALYLSRMAPGSSVLVVEPDPTYSQAATPRASGGVRQLFTRPENVQLSQHTLQVIDDWERFAGTADGPPPDLGWTRNGYLFIAGPDGLDTMATAFDLQSRLGVRAVWLGLADLAERHPQFAIDDLGGAVYSPDDGWLDPYSMLVGVRRAAIAAGASFVRDRVTGMTVHGTKVVEVQLASGEVVSAESTVNAAGTWAPELSDLVGMPVPVEPMRRYEHFVESPEDLRSLPFVKDARGLAIRPEGPGLSVGLVDFDHPGGVDLTIDNAYFEERVWPALVHRIPAMDKLRLRSTSVGLYDQNRLDGNAIIGNWPGRLDNYYLACGFSGHGLMHAPGVGRGLAELIVHGRFRTIDLTRLGYQRVLQNAPYAEQGIR